MLANMVRDLRQSLAEVTQQRDALLEALQAYRRLAWEFDWDYWTSGNAGDDSPAHQAEKKALAAITKAKGGEP